MIQRRNFLTGAMAVPLFASGIRHAAAQAAIEEIDTGEATILGISPDASTLVGRINRDQLTFLNTETLEVISTTEPIPAISHMNEPSMNWNPAGTHIAFSLDTWVRLIDSDIFVIEAATGELMNMTTEVDGEVAQDILDGHDVLADLYPAWIKDETLVFARHEINGDSPSVDLYSLKLTDDDPEHMLDLAAAGIQFVSAPIHALSDGRLVTLTDDLDRMTHVTIIDPAGSMEHLEIPFNARPELLDANDTHCLVRDPTIPGNMWLVAYNDPTAPVSLHDAFELRPMTPWKSTPIFGPEPETILWVVDGDATVMIRDANGIRELGKVPDGASVKYCAWSGTTAILVGGDTAWRVDTA